MEVPGHKTDQEVALKAQIKLSNEAHKESPFNLVTRKHSHSIQVTLSHSPWKVLHLFCCSTLITHRWCQTVGKTLDWKVNTVVDIPINYKNALSQSHIPNFKTNKITCDNLLTLCDT